MGMSSDHLHNLTCQNLPSLLSSFVDTFVDFSVSGGIFLLPSLPNPDLDSIPCTSNNPLSASPLRTVYPAPSRLVAIGDLHGDLFKTKQALRLAGLIDAGDRWSGGSTTVVQVGDVLDRGGDELKIIYFLEKLKREAARNNGRVITMNGNHEIMNIDGDFRFATLEGLEEFKDWAKWYCVGNDLKKSCDGLDGNFRDLFDGVPNEFLGVKPELLDGIRARIAALRPQGPISQRFLSENHTVVVVGDSIFVHGGLLPKHVEYGLERVNEDVREWIRGVKDRVDKDLVKGSNSIVWTRKFSNHIPKESDCSTLEHVLNTIPGARRMIMGHTIQNGITGACGERAIRIDVGMSRGCGNGLPEVLEITEESGIRVLTSNPLYARNYGGYFDAHQEGRNGFFVPERGHKQVEVNA